MVLNICESLHLISWWKSACITTWRCRLRACVSTLCEPHLGRQGRDSGVSGAAGPRCPRLGWGSGQVLEWCAWCVCVCV